MKTKRAFVTGSAGFIGFHISKKLLDEGWHVMGIDALTDYYDVSLKLARNAMLCRFPNYKFKKFLLEDFELLVKIVTEYNPTVVFHMAAQAGVRYSIENPRIYAETNFTGTFNLLEAIKNLNIEHFLLASSSSVYGSNQKMPYNENDICDNPMSIYAATKKATETISHSYSHLYSIPITCFRFFTVYGPWGRPDMALFKFTKAILEDETIDIFNNGDMSRDFTYIGDLIEALYRLINCKPNKVEMKGKKHRNETLSPVAPWRVINIGSSNPVNILNFIEALERCLGKKAKKNFSAIQPGEVIHTFADNNLLKSLTGYQANTDINVGIMSFITWYKEHILQKKGENIK